MDKAPLSDLEPAHTPTNYTVVEESWEHGVVEVVPVLVPIRADTHPQELQLPERGDGFDCAAVFGQVTADVKGEGTQAGALLGHCKQGVAPIVDLNLSR